jgi:hypothetical protein
LICRLSWNLTEVDSAEQYDYLNYQPGPLPYHLLQTEHALKNKKSMVDDIVRLRSSAELTMQSQSRYVVLLITSPHEAHQVLAVMIATCHAHCAPINSTPEFGHIGTSLGIWTVYMRSPPARTGNISAVVTRTAIGLFVE